MSNLLLISFSTSGAIALIIELLLVLGVLLLQRRSFKQTKQYIQDFQDCIPNEPQSAEPLFKLTQLHIPEQALKEYTPTELLEFQSLYRTAALNTIAIDIICPSYNHSNSFDAIRDALNTYLLRNRGAAADFNLIKDVVERHTTAIENDIQLTLQAPLYLGLGGTMSGIVVGLLIFVLNVSSNNATTNLSVYTDGINELLIGVFLGMLASVAGLGFTVYNSVINYKGAKSKAEHAKNQFYTFVQIELLPVLSRNITSSFHTLHQNLTQFNNGFNTNLSSFQNQLKDFNTDFGNQLTNFNQMFNQNLASLTIVSNKNVEALQQQAVLLKTLENIDLRKFIKAHLTIFDAFERSSNKLNQFNEYLDKVNQFAATTTELNGHLKDLLTRTNNFYDLSQRVENNLERNNKLTEFLNLHTDVMQAHAEKEKRAITKLEDAFENNLASLSGTLRDNRSKMELYLNEEITRLRDMMRRNSGGFMYLEYLEKLNGQLQAFQQEGGQNHQTFVKILETIQAQLAISNTQSNQNQKRFTEVLENQLNYAQQIAQSDAEKLNKHLETQFKNLGQQIERAVLSQQRANQSKSNTGKGIEVISKKISLGQRILKFFIRSK